MAEVIRDLRESLVNPDGNFVTQQQPDDMSKTIVISKMICSRSMQSISSQARHRLLSSQSAVCVV